MKFETTPQESSNSSLEQLDKENFEVEVEFGAKEKEKEKEREI